MIEDQLENLRKEYRNLTPPVYLVHQGWSDLANQLDERQTTDLRLLFGKGLVFASVILLLFGGLVTAAQAAKPGETLYPVKLLSDSVAARVSGKPEITVEKRGQEIIDLSQKPSEQLNEATKQYQKALDDSARQAKDSGKQQDFEKALDNQKQKFEREIEKNPQSKGLEDAIKKTEQTQGQVQGQKTESHDKSNKSSNHEGDHNQQNHGRDNHSD